MEPTQKVCSIQTFKQPVVDSGHASLSAASTIVTQHGYQLSSSSSSSWFMVINHGPSTINHRPSTTNHRQRNTFNCAYRNLHVQPFASIMDVISDTYQIPNVWTPSIPGLWFRCTTISTNIALKASMIVCEFEFKYSYWRFWLQFENHQQANKNDYIMTCIQFDTCQRPNR